jgi:adenosylcobyric acid synthase
VLIAVPQLARIANFDDLDPLMAEPGLRVEIIPPGRPLPLNAALILIPGSKSTLADLAFLRAQGWDIDIRAALRHGARVMGLCGGYQMLGQTIADPDGIEGAAQQVEGLGLLDVHTIMHHRKQVRLTEGIHLPTQTPVTAYEIHLGQTQGPDCTRPMFDTPNGPDGASSADGRVTGSYLHGMFASDNFRAAWLAALGAHGGQIAYGQQVEATLDALADHLQSHIDCASLLSIARTGL